LQHAALTLTLPRMVDRGRQAGRSGLFFVVHRFAGYAALAIPRTSAITVNFTVLALSVLLTVGATFIFGVLPALRVLRVKPQQALQGMSRTSGSRRGSLLRRWLVGAQVFACTTLLLVAGLLVVLIVLRLNLRSLMQWMICC